MQTPPPNDDGLTPDDPAGEHEESPRPPQAPVRLPSKRWSALLVVAALALGGVVGAAFGPAPQASFAGGALNLAKALPLLLASGRPATTATTATSTAASAETPASTTTQPTRSTRTAATKTTEPAPAEEKEAAAKESPTAKSKLPVIKNVWLIQLSGTGFEAAEAAPAAAPYIDTELIPKSTFLGKWSATTAAAFATEALVTQSPAAGTAPPLLHTIVQPPCPEGAAGAACAAETPGALSTADDFLKATLATITGTALYREGGLIVVTFADVGIATQSELPAGASTSTLTSTPPAGAAVLSPLAKAGRSSLTFNPTSPKQSIEALLG
jgi:hypothetical protein